MQVTLALLADAANLSQEGKLNVLGAFSNIGATAMPARHPEMNLVLEIEASPSELGVSKNFDVKLLDADGVVIGGLSGKFTIPRPARPGRGVYTGTILRLNDVVFPKAGDYVFDILIEGDSKKQVPLSVTLVEKDGEGDAS